MAPHNLSILSLLFVALLVVSLTQSATCFADSTNIQLWNCEDNSPGQKWVFQNDTTIRLVSDNTKCVDISNYGTNDGANIWLFTCHTDDKTPSQLNQEWTYNSNGTITSVMSGKCLEASGDQIEPGTNIQLNTCTGQDNQRWTHDSSAGSIKCMQSGLCIDVGSIASCMEKPWSGYGYCDMSQSAEQRAMDLVSRLDLTEKVSLMLNDKSGVPRLGVPPFGHTECTHGTLNDGQLLTTLFPQALTVAQSFDRDLVHSIGRAISDEVRGKHNDANKEGKHNYPNGLICWAPVVNICRDPRWGRCQEGYGEDPYLQAEFGTSYVKGLQFGPDTKYLQAIATCKHFDVHAGPENVPESRFQFDAKIDYRDWIETFQPAFKACADAGALSFMCSYNAINGVPSCANRELLTDLLRNTWKFDGFVVSDCGAVGNVYHRHNFARSDEEAAQFCVKAGCDWNCGNEYVNLINSVQDGFMSESELDVSVMRNMKGFIMLGVLDPPDSVSYNKLTLAVVDTHKDLNAKAAMESIVLLENRKNVLPLNFDSYKSVAVIGPCADNPTCARGDYDPNPKYIITPKAAFASSTKLTVNYSPGCSDVQCTNNSGFDDAVQKAKASDFVVYVGGTSKDIEGEGRDRPNITLPGLQTDLILMLKQSNKPLIVVLMHGSPVPSYVYNQSSVVDAVISAGYTGQEAGNAIVSVLNGATNPAGRLVVTWYTGNEQLPPMVNYSMMNRTYRYMEGQPQYYFGYGLSYTTFEYSSLALSPTTLSACQNVSVSFKVQNTGKVTGDEVAQVYMSFKNSSVPAPNLKLVNFERLAAMKASETRSVQLNITASQMTVVQDKDYVQVIQPGTYMVYAGGSQPGDTNAPSKVLSAAFTITGDTKPLSSC